MLDVMGLASGLGPRLVEKVATRVVASRGLEAVAEGPGFRVGLGVLRHPVTAVRSGASATMNLPTLVTRTVAYQFDLAGAGLAIPDLAAAGEVPGRVREARAAADEVSRELRRSGTGGR